MKRRRERFPMWLAVPSLVAMARRSPPHAHRKRQIPLKLRSYAFDAVPWVAGWSLLGFMPSDWKVITYARVRNCRAALATRHVKTVENSKAVPTLRSKFVNPASYL